MDRIGTVNVSTDDETAKDPRLMAQLKDLQDRLKGMSPNEILKAFKVDSRECFCCKVILNAPKYDQCCDRFYCSHCLLSYKEIYDDEEQKNGHPPEVAKSICIYCYDKSLIQRVFTIDNFPTCCLKKLRQVRKLR